MCPTEFKKYMTYCRNLEFTQKPDYTYLKSLFASLADKEGIDIHDKVFDWSVKAVTISSFPGFYDFSKQ